MRSSEQLLRLELSCFISESHGTIVQLCVSLRCSCYGNVVCYETAETAHKQVAL